MAQSTVDTVFTLLSNEMRRLLCHYFLARDSPTATVDDLVTHLLEYDLSGAARDRQHLRTELLHRHLPKLADAAVIDYDERTETVRYHGHPLLKQVLRTVADFSDDTSTAGLAPSDPTEFRQALTDLLHESDANNVPVPGVWGCRQNTDQYWEVRVVPMQAPPDVTE